MARAASRAVAMPKAVKLAALAKASTAYVVRFCGGGGANAGAG